jgi:hypothetical protein
VQAQAHFFFHPLPALVRGGATPRNPRDTGFDPYKSNQWIHLLLPRFSPLSCFSGFAVGRDEEPSGGRNLRLIQIRLAMPSLEKISPAVKPIRREH